MINIIASVLVKKGKVQDFLEVFKAHALRVREEPGCIEYFPAVDLKTDLPPQVLDENVVTILKSGRAWRHCSSI